ncbi:hypothetical protein NDR87_32090 [Nocardia sp. CDC159]|uniref:Uncharacterized protein n=1 Tax=Nocardia pulmonis TaxID=2951408 RepID=A0A9X2J056_9NOCA|nr:MULTISPECIES: hypothetical protein [Nocardia]MCM6778133.1 hypothetical protein [Nocardia pulmonis]MCM6791022.1 hypothetical protein [Nocardia sp. CDC159]
MQLKFLGKSTAGGQSPTLYASDRSTYVCQGWRTGEADRIEIPHRLLQYLEPGTCLGTVLQDTGRGTFILRGEPVIDPEVLAQMNIPDHEMSVEIPMGQEVRPDATPLR